MGLAPRAARHPRRFALLGSSHDPGAPNVPDLPERRCYRGTRSVRGGQGDIGPEGTVKVATFRLAGSEFSCDDSPVVHAWGFTPAVSLWIDCDDNSELERLFDRLSDGGQVFMPLDDYGFSTRFGWVGDRHGVTWQLNLR